MSDLIYLVRHGQTEWNRLGLAQGHTDTDLDSEGLRQAEAVGARFRGVHLDWLVSSDLKRSQQTAQAIRTEIELDSDLRERCFGDWEGQVYSEIRERLGLAVGPHEVTPPNGEDFGTLWERVSRAAARIHARKGTGMIVTHGGTCGVLLAQLIGGTPRTALSFRFANTGVCVLERGREDYCRLIGYNDVSHLSDPVLSGDLGGVHA